MSTKTVILLRKSYLSRIKNAVGTRMFRNLFVAIDGREHDVAKGGRLSCALFGSTVLVSFHLLKEVHGSVSATIRDMEVSGWVRVQRPRVGCVVIWENPTRGPGESGLHLGFYIGQGQAISNSSKKRSPHVHLYKKQPVHALYWHPRLE